MVRGMHAMAPTKSSANLARKPPVPSSKKAESAADRQVAELQRQIAAASEREAALANLLESSGVDSIAGGAIDWELDACRALLDEEVTRRNFAILTPQFPDRSTLRAGRRARGARARLAAGDREQRGAQIDGGGAARAGGAARRDASMLSIQA